MTKSARQPDQTETQLFPPGKGRPSYSTMNPFVFSPGLRSKEALMQRQVDQSHFKFTPTQTGDTTCVQCRGIGDQSQ